MDNPSQNPGPPRLAMGEDDKYFADRAKLYEWHKNCGTLAIFYEMYPYLRPPEPQNGRQR